ncbi:hypothetical protein BD410DRAFT_781591 [Rickenella mellea]|uniref:Uncharacterized protein n=1 Tax=Rickenella mellea TaxID=50990 RepID=A0A4Y7QJA1_9AGAM|nr:hypothetical protein BD410DRAFT_781591 [Rickenella mellea]
MVSADNLNFDVLTQIFAYLYGNDLVSVSLVSRSFLTSVTPKLYQTLVFCQSQAKRYPRIFSPFTTILARPELATHVRTCDISAIANYKGRPHQQFMSECITALEKCQNLSRFYCTLNVLPSFLLVLTKKSRLEDIRVRASLEISQSKLLVEMKGLQSVALDSPSWSLMNLLPDWLGSMSPSLTHLTITRSNEISETILGPVLRRLPSLLGLQIISCPKVEHFKVLELVRHTPRLQNLAFTTWESPETSTCTYADLCHLQSLTMETRNHVSPDSVTALWSGIISTTSRSGAPLASLTLKTTRKSLIAHSLVQEIIKAHSATLQQLRLINCSIGNELLKDLAQKCDKLGKLCVAIPLHDIKQFARSISESMSLHTLVDVPEPHGSHAPGRSLREDDVRELMYWSPKLRRIISDNRSWEGNKLSTGALQITLERFRLAAMKSEFMITTDPAFD